MFIAARGVPSPWLMAATLFGGALSAASANVLNCYLDRDIDALMRRTARRPLPAHRVEPADALRFGLVLGVAGFVWLWATVNLLSAVLATSAILFYVFVYTIGLKRRSTQNIVIGGAAGAVPVLVGWSAVTGRVDLPALVLFAIIFYWTPPHFWALSLRYQDDYAAAGVPMLPVVRGAKETSTQILYYTVLLVAVTLLLYPAGRMGALYLAAAVALGGAFIWRALELRRDLDRPAGHPAVQLLQHLPGPALLCDGRWMRWCGEGHEVQSFPTRPPQEARRPDTVRRARLIGTVLVAVLVLAGCGSLTPVTERGGRDPRPLQRPVRRRRDHLRAGRGGDRVRRGPLPAPRRHAPAPVPRQQPARGGLDGGAAADRGRPVRRLLGGPQPGRGQGRQPEGDRQRARLPVAVAVHLPGRAGAPAGRPAARGPDHQGHHRQAAGHVPPGGRADPVQHPGPGRHPLLLRARVPVQAGRLPRPHQHLRPDHHQAGRLRRPVHRVLRAGPPGDALHHPRRQPAPSSRPGWSRPRRRRPAAARPTPTRARSRPRTSPSTRTAWPAP